MNMKYNLAARRAVMKRPAQLSGVTIPGINRELSDADLIRWVIVPGGTVVGMVLLSSILRRKRK